MLRLVIASLILLMRTAWGAAPTIDGNAHANFSTGVSAYSVTLTTSNSSDIIVAVIWAAQFASPSNNVTSLSGGGLSWSRRKQSQDAFPSPACAAAVACWGDLEVWEAVASGPLSAVTITANLALSTTGFGDMLAFGVSSVLSTTTPHDANSGLPYSAKNLTTTNTAIQVTGITTNETNDLIVGYLGSYTSDCVGIFATAPNSLIACDKLGFSVGAAGRQIQSGPVSGLTMSANIASGQAWVMFVDAFHGSAVSAPGAFYHQTPWMMGR